MNSIHSLELINSARCYRLIICFYCNVSPQSITFCETLHCPSALNSQHSTATKLSRLTNVNITHPRAREANKLHELGDSEEEDGVSAV